jgi:hypothetical protein
MTGAITALVADLSDVHLPSILQTAGGGAIVGGVALTGTRSVGVATIAGLCAGAGLVALGMLPGHVLLSLVGSLGLMINVPWAIGWFFPGQGRAPLLVFVSGVLIVVVAVLLSRMGGRFRRELGGRARRADGAV